MAELRMKAALENLGAATEFVERELTAAGCPPKPLSQMVLVMEEIFVNVASYAYVPGVDDGSGTKEVVLQLCPLDPPTGVSLTFLDWGIPYDPLKKPDPDISLSAGERRVGGLGIFLAKKLTDAMHYERRDGMNVLTVLKRWQ